MSRDWTSSGSDLQMGMLDKCKETSRQCLVGGAVVSELGTYMQRHVAPVSWASRANCNSDLAEASLDKLILSQGEGAIQARQVAVVTV